MSNLLLAKINPFKRNSRLQRKQAKQKDKGINFNLGIKSKLLKALILVLLFLLLSIIVFSIVSIFAIRSTKFPDRTNSGTIKWEGKDNLNVLLIGIDHKQDDLEFVDSLQLLYIQPENTKVDILSIDPNLSVDIYTSGDDFGDDTKNSYEYRQLLNYYNSQDFLNGTDIALQEFIYAVEAELGLNIDRYVILQASNFTEITTPFYRLPVEVEEKVVITSEERTIGTGSKRLSPADQLKFISTRTENPNIKLRRQNEAVRNYLLSIDNPIISIIFGYQTLFGGGISDLIETNFTGKELWNLYSITRDLNNVDVSTGITAEEQKFIVEERKYLDRKIFDESIRRLYFNQPVVEEQGRIDVINGSGKPGLASSTKRILTNHSFNIVRVDNSEEAYARNTLFIDNPLEYPQTIHQLKLFYPDLEIKQENYSHRPTGDMVLVVI